MELKDIRVFVCVPGVGKTYLTKLDDRFVDMDIEKAKYKYNLYDKTDREIEFLKGNNKCAVNGNSIGYIENLTKKYMDTTDKILLFAPNPQIVEMIVNNGYPYCLVYHTKDSIVEIEKRMRDRGNQENFIRSMIDPIDTFYKASTEDTRPAFKIELTSKEYLSEKLLPLFEDKK